MEGRRKKYDRHFQNEEKKIVRTYVRYQSVLAPGWFVFFSFLSALCLILYLNAFFFQFLYSYRRNKEDGKNIINQDFFFCFIVLLSFVVHLIRSTRKVGLLLEFCLFCHPPEYAMGFFLFLRPKMHFASFFG